VPFKIGERADDPLQMYLSDVCTLPVNMPARMPGISIPAGFAQGLPIGMQIIGKPFAEETLRENQLCLPAGHRLAQANGKAVNPRFNNLFPSPGFLPRWGQRAMVKGSTIKIRHVKLKTGVFEMQMRYLGKSGIKVSELCLGTMTFGAKVPQLGKVDQKAADNLVQMALDAGINFFDTADVYAKGASEEILGKSFGKAAQRYHLSRPRFAPDSGRGPNDVGMSRHHIIEGCEASLKRLETDYIDLYQIHSFDAHTPLEETMGALDDLVRQG